jgi:geranylgeranyl pyrophosphate synthase
MNKVVKMHPNYINEGLTAVETKLETIVESEVQLLEDAGLHIITSGGKRIRPRIALLAYLATGNVDYNQVIPMAAAVEMVHTATLVHDDINDHSMTRRGKATVHAKWGRTFALLTGDFLFTKVYEMMAPYHSDYNVIMAEACKLLVEGETLQAAAAKSGDMDRETYKQIISLKTASLFEAAARMGAMLGNANDEVIEALAKYAYNLGLCFQIVDDILDIVGDPEALGKPIGTDLAQNRGVMVSQNGGTAVQEAVAEAVEDDPIAALMAKLRDSGAMEIARMQAVEMGSRARNALAPVPDSIYKQEMLDMIDLVLERNN